MGMTEYRGDHMTEKRNKPDQYQLRFPPGLRDRLKAAATVRGRSMNEEIVHRLESSFASWPRVTLPGDLAERVSRADPRKRIPIEAEVNELVADFVGKRFPAPPALHRDWVQMFHRLLDEMPDQDQDRFRERFDKLSMEMMSRKKGPDQGERS